MKWTAFVGFCALLALGVVSTPWVFADDAPAIAPIMKTDRMMKVFADPIIDNLKAALKQAPETPKGWRAIQDQGEAAGEVANLSMMRTGEHENTPEWKQLSDGMKKAGLALADSATKKDFADAQAKYTALVKTCNDCHKKFEPDTAPEVLP